MNTTHHIYNQVAKNSDRSIPPKSRTKVLKRYFKKYMPFLNERYEKQIDRFIDWDDSYEEMLRIFTVEFFIWTTQNAVKYFLEWYSPTYSSENSEFLSKRRGPYISEELKSFIEVFWPRLASVPNNRVPGTISRNKEMISGIWAW